MIMKSIWQQFATFCLLTEKFSCIKHEFIRNCPLLKMPTLADPAHVSVIRFVLLFTQVAKLIKSSRIIRSQDERTNNRVALWTFRSNKRNFSATEVPFQEEITPSPSQLTIITGNNVKPFIQALTCMSSGIHGIWNIIWTQIHDF